MLAELVLDLHLRTQGMKVKSIFVMDMEEFSNLVESQIVGRLESKRNLQGVKINIFTDNSTAESAFYNTRDRRRQDFVRISFTIEKIEVIANSKIIIVHMRELG
jgi:ribosomal silencing factor RsfS